MAGLPSSDGLFDEHDEPAGSARCLEVWNKKTCDRGIGERCDDARQEATGLV